MLDKSREEHRVRFFFPLELERFLEDVGLRLVSLSEFPTLDGELGAQSWNASREIVREHSALLGEDTQSVMEAFIASHLDELANGAKTFDLPQGFGRQILPDGTFLPATKVRLVPSKSGVKTAFPTN